MPKTPITYREGFYVKTKNGTIRFLDMASVDTSIGAMIELLPKVWGADDVPNEAVLETDFNKISEVDEDQFFRLMNHQGTSTLIDRT